MMDTNMLGRVYGLVIFRLIQIVKLNLFEEILIRSS